MRKRAIGFEASRKDLIKAFVGISCSEVLGQNTCIPPWSNDRGAVLSSRTLRLPARLGDGRPEVLVVLTPAMRFSPSAGTFVGGRRYLTHFK